MKPISHSFLDWVVARLKEAIPAELKADVPVYDDRSIDLPQLIAKAVNKGLGACVAVSLPGLSKEGDPEPSNTQYRVTVEVGVAHNAAVKSDLNSHALAETLFRSFAGAEFHSGGVMAFDVGVDDLHSTVQNAHLTHLFSVYYTLTI